MRLTHSCSPLMNPIHGCTECVCPPEIITRLFSTNKTLTFCHLPPPSTSKPLKISTLPLPPMPRSESCRLTTAPSKHATNVPVPPPSPLQPLRHTCPHARYFCYFCLHLSLSPLPFTLPPSSPCRALPSVLSMPLIPTSPSSLPLRNRKHQNCCFNCLCRCLQDPATLHTESLHSHHRLPRSARLYLVLDVAAPSRCMPPTPFAIHFDPSIHGCHVVMPVGHS
jgi:hypothetical protein